MACHNTTSGAIGALVFPLCLVMGCDDSYIPNEPEEAKVYVIAAIDPDFTDLSNVEPGRLIWLSSRSGRASFHSGGREIANQAAVSGGELCTTIFEPFNLVPGANTIDIRLVLQGGGGELSEQAQLYVTAECTIHDHCAGSCVQFRCQ